MPLTDRMSLKDLTNFPRQKKKNKEKKGGGCVIVSYFSALSSCEVPRYSWYESFKFHMNDFLYVSAWKQ